jgi:hypothetical protein
MTNYEEQVRQRAVRAAVDRRLRAFYREVLAIAEQGAEDLFRRVESAAASNT